jgi:hypothetical protein
MLVSDRTPSLKIVQHVLQHGHDLLIKEAKPRNGGGRGFKAIDMELLRKCPCAVWLCRPIAQSRQHIQVAVAIEPESTEPAAIALSKRMLQLSCSLADSCSGELHIISCWDYEFESFLRGSAWVKVPDAEIAGAVLNMCQSHRAALEGLVTRTATVRGRAEQAIVQPLHPCCVQDNSALRPLR